MITLYGIPASASTGPRICLEEAQAPYAFVPISRTPPGPQEFVRISPHLKVPALVDGDLTLTESAAITMYLSDRYPASGLAPTTNEPERADWYEWMMLLTTAIQAPLYQVIYPERFTTDRLMVGRVREQATRVIEPHIERIDDLLGGREYLLGDRFSSADIFLFMLMPWTRHIAHPMFVRTHAKAYFERLAKRPSIARVVALEGIV